MRKSIHTPEYAALRAELRRAREAANLSQRDLAAVLDVAPSWIANAESGERRIDLIEFCWFMAACGQDPQEAFDQLAKRLTPKRAAKGGRR